MSGTIKGNNGKWGRVTINCNGSMLLENVTLSDIDISCCELHAESGEYPLCFGDRMNRLCDFAGDGHQGSPDNKLSLGGSLPYVA